jgi:hypothetical protein
LNRKYRDKSGERGGIWPYACMLLTIDDHIARRGRAFPIRWSFQVIPGTDRLATMKDLI